eukprot:CAMPEP_0113703108 /NCGR_PEP_ID=MMETSP0038_2-20120614/25636_1 /TAXON_ID=2898 /ORGANISM="Cryptomonas paramecium" /LENGTH=32 /DNA_ID=CAMNT_0000627453 /DNA_START=42 /DNA_END=140 /DNA_ORIENTATION=+ /assembly_acc=CAM_ASM_000170
MTTVTTAWTWSVMITVTTAWTWSVTMETMSPP